MGAENFSVKMSIIEKGKKAPTYRIEEDMDGQKTLEDLFRYTKNALINISEIALKEEQIKGFDKKPVLVVDNKFNRPVEEVSPLGKIQYIARASAKKLILYAYTTILQRSKVVTGEYFKNNWVFFNGNVVAKNILELERWLETRTSFEQKDKIRFVNMAPYARKLERLGVSKGSTTRKYRKPKKHEKRRGTLSVLAPNGTYALSTRAIKQKFKNNSFIKFELMQGSSIGLVGKGRTYGKRSLTPGRPYLYPTILIYLVEAGINDGKLQ